tara:strand:- start:867 stop:1217 length:351 start_codon:yes stop_codon:yes gene_type:complete
MCGVYIRAKNGRKKLRMISIDDLRNHRTDNLIKDINLGSYEVFSKKPKTCCSCDSKYIYNIEIFGAIKAPLLWECGKCDKTFLKYEVSETLTNFRLASRVWTNPQDWGFQDPADFS